MTPRDELRGGLLRRALVVVLVAVVVVSMASSVWQYLAASRAPTRLELSEVSGEVHLQHTTGAGGDADPTAGTVLGPDDRVATGPNGRAVLELGRETHIRLGPESAIQVTGVDESGVSLELENGALQATVRPESGGVRVANRGREVLATNGEFTVGVTEDVLQVSATSGSLSLSGVDQTRVEEGDQATILDRHAEVAPIPEELLLAVQWPQEARTRAETTRVTGRSDPGAKIRLTGSFGVRTVTAGADGSFVADVPLSEGDNPIKVEEVDLMGRATWIDGMLPTRDTTGPSFKGGVDYSGHPPGEQPPLRGEPSGEQPPLRGEPSGEQPPLRGEPSGEQPPLRGEPSGEQPPLRGEPSGEQPPLRGVPSGEPLPLRGVPSGEPLPLRGEPP